MNFEDELRKAQQVNMAARQQVAQANQQSQQRKQPNAFESFFNWIGDTAGAIGNTLKDTVGAIGSIGATNTANSLREKREQASKQRLDEIAKKYGFNSFNEISDEAWQNNKEMNDELKKATKENSAAANAAADAYKNNWAVKNTADVKQGDYGANAIKTWNTLADVLTAPVNLPASMAINAGQGYLSAIGDEMQGKSDLSNMNWGNVAKQGAANALAGAAGGAAGAGLGKVGSKLLGSNSKLAKGLGRLSNTGIARGAASGAAGGATGAGLGTALEGGNLEQILANAAAGAQQGAGTGAVMGGAMSLGNKAVNKVKDMADNARQKIGSESQPGFSLASENQPTSKSNIAQDVTDANSTYGESALANSTSKQNLANRVKKVGQYLEGSQVSPTRAEIREILGNKSAGEAIDAVRRKTGLSDIDVQAQFADEITGKNGMLDLVQKDILTYGEDGKPITIKISDLSDDIDSIVNKHIKNATKGANRENMIADFKSDLSNPETSAIDLANSYREQARELRTKGSINPSGAEKAQARVYDEIAGKIEDSFYNKLSKEQINSLFDSSINEAKNRAKIAKENNNKKIAKAYEMVADDLSKLPRNVKSFRGYKKDYVDINKLYGKHAAANQVGSRSNIATGIAAGAMTKNPLVGVATAIGTRVLPEPLNDVLGWAGGKVSDVGDKLSSSKIGSVNIPTLPQGQTPIGNFPYALVGRLSGTEEASQAMANPDTYAQPATNLEAQLGNTALSTEGNGYTAPTTMASYGTGTYANTGYAGTGNNMLDRLVGGMENALNAGDISAFSQLAEIYNTLAKVYGVGSNSSTTSQQKLSATQQRANAAINSLERLSGMTPDVGYTLSGIPIIGDIATIGGNAYEGEAKSLAQQIGYMVSGSNIKQEEAEAIGKAYVPQPFDSEYTRQLKLQRAREIISQYQNGVAETPTETYAY